MKHLRSLLVVLALLIGGTNPAWTDEAMPRQVSGIYPTLAMFNNEGECGTGAVVVWVSFPATGKGAGLTATGP